MDLISLPGPCVAQVLASLEPVDLLTLAQASRSAALLALARARELGKSVVLRVQPAATWAGIRQVLSWAGKVRVELWTTGPALYDRKQSPGPHSAWEALTGKGTDPLAIHQAPTVFPLVQDVMIHGALLPPVVPPAAARAFPNMQALRLEGCCMASAASTIKFPPLPRCANLTQLHVQSCLPWMRPAGTSERLRTALPKVHTLIMETCKDHPAGFGPIGRFPLMEAWADQLLQLEVDWVPMLDLKVAEMSSLISLTLHTYDGYLCPAARIPLPANASNLREFRLPEHDITCNFIQQLLDRAPGLRRVAFKNVRGLEYQESFSGVPCSWQELEICTPKARLDMTDISALPLFRGKITATMFKVHLINVPPGTHYAVLDVHARALRHLERAPLHATGSCVTLVLEPDAALAALNTPASERTDPDIAHQVGRTLPYIRPVNYLELKLPVGPCVLRAVRQHLDAHLTHLQIPVCPAVLTRELWQEVERFSKLNRVTMSGTLVVGAPTSTMTIARHTFVLRLAAQAAASNGRGCLQLAVAPLPARIPSMAEATVPYIIISTAARMRDDDYVDAIITGETAGKHTLFRITKAYHLSQPSDIPSLVA